MEKIFFDTEFTGLHQGTSLMSIGLTDEFGDSFYAELTDYDPAQINNWLRDNVLANFRLSDQPEGVAVREDDDLSLCRSLTLRGNSAQVKAALTEWLITSEVRKGPVQMWSDCLAYDWVLFNALLADYSHGYPQLPANVHYIPMDICTLFELKGIDPDVSREKFAFGEVYKEMPKHNALWDAQLIKQCYFKLMGD